MTDQAMIAAGGADVAAEFKGVKVPASPFLNDTRIQRINTGRYEGQEIAGALHVTGSEDRVVELGAGIGLVGAVIARNARPAAMMSFEANPALIPHIQALYARNGLSEAITLKHAVLLSSPARPPTVDFHVRSSYLGSSLITDARRRATTVAVPTASWSELRDQFEPTVLVMDIEGGELDFLTHADLAGLRAVVIEFHPQAYGQAGMKRCKSLLRDAGFARVADHSTRTVWAATREV